MGLLADAFSEFIAAAARLEASYGELQGQVAELGIELAERNAALNASLAENERMRLALQQIVDTMPCGVMVLERDGLLSMINPEGRRLLKVDPDHAPGLAALSVQAGIDLSAFVKEHGIAEGEHEFSVAGAGGKRWIEVRNRRVHAAGPDKEPGRSAYQTILILRDVSAHKQAEQERERGRKATALAEIAAMLAHEIRNPLASMELFAGLLAESQDVTGSGGPELQWISHMRAGIRSLSGTVNNVLSFQGAGFPVQASIELASAIESSVEFVRPIAEQSGVELHFHAETGEARVLGNESALQQLLLNLISNAVRHTPKRGQVRVSVRPVLGSRGRLLIEVSDTGSGIRPDQINDIFRAGFSGTGNSSGLGLAVCKQIVKQHDGAMRVVSTLTTGTTFHVELPAL